jgi:hypothetical protein
MDLGSFDPTWLFLSMIPAGIGFVLFVYGKKQQRWPQLVAGIAMMVYPYFTSTITAMMAVGALICVALWYVVRMGY